MFSSFGPASLFKPMSFPHRDPSPEARIMGVVIPVICLLLTCCAAVPQEKADTPLDGTWFSVTSLNDTDYLLDDCVYDSQGTFRCTALDHGCAGGFCEGHMYEYSGVWGMEGNQFVRECTSDTCKEGAEFLKIARRDRGQLQFEGGARWFRKKWQRDDALHRSR